MFCCIKSRQRWLELSVNTVYGKFRSMRQLRAKSKRVRYWHGDCYKYRAEGLPVWAVTGDSQAER